jgi:hypothetical protein
MTTKDYIKLLVVAAGYTKNIKVDIDQYGIDRMYSVYAEKFDHNDDGFDVIIIDALGQSLGLVAALTLTIGEDEEVPCVGVILTQFWSCPHSL